MSYGELRNRPRMRSTEQRTTGTGTVIPHPIPNLVHNPLVRKPLRIRHPLSKSYTSQGRLTCPPHTLEVVSHRLTYLEGSY